MQSRMSMERGQLANMNNALVRNALGDVVARMTDGVEVSLDPDEWGWLGKGGKNRPGKRRAISHLEALPGFTVAITPGPRFEPGPKLRRNPGWRKWAAGSAPAAAALSKAGEGGTRAMFDRLSDALGLVAHELPRNPDRAPFHVYDFVGGQFIEVGFNPPPPLPTGQGTVYLLDDGAGVKIGYTGGSVASRVGSLQTGNPRRISVLAEVRPADEAVEAHLHRSFARYALIGEWFSRAGLLERAASAGGLKQMLAGCLPNGDWTIVVHTAGEPL